MVIRIHVVLLLCAVLTVAVGTSAAAAKWAPQHDGDPSSSASIGPGGNAGPDHAGGADPDEPLGPERVAGASSWLVSPTGDATDSWSRLVYTLIRLGWVGWVR